MSEKINLYQQIEKIEFIKDALKKKLNIYFGNRVIDYLMHYPKSINYKNYIVRPITIEDLGKQITIDIQVVNIKFGFIKLPSTILCTNKHEQKIKIIYFNISRKFVSERFKKGQFLRITGNLRIFKNEFQILHPISILDFENLKDFCQFEPIYNLKKTNIRQRQFFKLIKSTITKVEFLPMNEWINKKFLEKYEWENFNISLKSIHEPKTHDILDLEKFRKRLAFDEILSNLLVISLIKRKEHLHLKSSSINNCFLSKKIINDLDFELTGDQMLAYKQVSKDLRSNNSMFRLLQGDVGSGKTIISLLAVVDTLNNGFQGAIMVPSEILARQHFDYFSNLLKNYDFKIRLLTGKISVNDKKQMYKDIKNNKVNLIIGTHALFNKELDFYNLGIIVIDEQHKFGVNQRVNLLNKSENSNVLIMSATPIPRSLTFVIYGEVDISIIREKPKNRKKISTSIIGTNKIKDLTNGLKRLLRKNQKIFWVLPEIGMEQESPSKSSVLKRYDYLAQEFGNKVAFIHGKMKNNEINCIVEKFRNENIMILVSTTLIEVGIDIPGATTIVIEEANKFGLAQLHQLRGRVGRNNLNSNCILFHNNQMSENGRKRLEIMRMSDDGFYIAEKDLEMRGGGDIFGTKQTGLPSWKFFNPYRDINLIEDVKENLRNFYENKKECENIMSIFFDKGKLSNYFSG